jgi:hypothetical protein
VAGNKMLVNSEGGDGLVRMREVTVWDGLGEGSLGVVVPRNRDKFSSDLFS